MAGNDVTRPGTAMDVADLPGGRGKNALPLSHSMPTNSANAGANRWIGFLAEVRIGNVTLHAFDR